VIIDQCAKDGEITERQSYIDHPTLPWCGCTLDGYRAFDDAVIEAKTLNPWGDRDENIYKYTPQVLVQMRCRGASRGILAMLRGFSLEQVEVYIDEDYEREVWARLAAFQLCVDMQSPPDTRPILLPPEQWRTIDLQTENPNWGPDMRHELRMWADTHESARMHQKAKDSIKELLPPDVGTVLLDRLSVKRSKSNAITIRERQ
jgi:hypothetical protein